ncbi:hypothetical protein C3L33_16348, partial [Rhododendron williamsianum]
DFKVDYESEENAQVVYSALAVDKEFGASILEITSWLSTTSCSTFYPHYFAGILKLLKQDFFAHPSVLSWTVLHLLQKQLKNLDKEWNYDILLSTLLLLLVTGFSIH